MGTTLTLKNIPDPVYQRLKRSADLNRRSMNSEILVCLEAVLLPAKPSTEERLARARALRDGLAPVVVSSAEIDSEKRQGRP